jgi:serine/threonine protein kinase
MYLPDACAGYGWLYYPGTYAYAAPEVLLSARSKQVKDAPDQSSVHGPPVDLWAFGVTALELLTGCYLLEPDDRARPAEISLGSEECQDWYMQYTADLHEQWVSAVARAVLSPLELYDQICLNSS